MGKPTELKTPQIVQFECSNRDDEVFIRSAAFHFEFLYSLTLFSTQLSYMPTKSPKFAEFAGGQEHGFHVHGTGIIADENGNIDCGLTGGHFTKDGQAHSDPTNESRFEKINVFKPHPGFLKLTLTLSDTLVTLVISGETRVELWILKSLIPSFHLIGIRNHTLAAELLCCTNYPTILPEQAETPVLDLAAVSLIMMRTNFLSCNKIYSLKTY